MADKNNGLACLIEACNLASSRFLSDAVLLVHDENINVPVEQLQYLHLLLPTKCPIRLSISMLVLYVSTSLTFACVSWRSVPNLPAVLRPYDVFLYRVGRDEHELLMTMLC